MKTIKQTCNNTCMYCVCAMISNTSESYVIDWFKNYGSGIALAPEDAIIFLVHHGIYLASSITNADNDMGVDYYAIINFDGFELFICVDSESFPGLDHVVYWDGEQLYDPNPNTKRTKLNEYKINYIYPISRAKRRAKKWKL